MKKNKTKLPFLPNKKLGQNFLSKKKYLQKIVNCLAIDSNTILIEIGSGYGHLTKFLANTDCQQIISLEKDKQLFNWLQTNWVSNNKQKVLFLNKDALNIDWEEFFQEYVKDKNASLTIVGNLPYNIANSLICELLIKHKLFTNFLFLVQKEVAQRWVANSKSYKKEYSALSVYVNLLATTEIKLEIPAEAFNPSPLVNGALVLLKIKTELAIEQERLAKFFLFVKKCFHYRRKTLYNNLISFVSKKEYCLENITNLGYEKNIRPQELAVDDYLQLYKGLTN